MPHGKTSETWDELELNRDFGCDHSNASATRCGPRLGEEANVAVAEPWKPQFFGGDMYRIL